MIEISKYQAFSLIEEKGQQALHEKVLRCQAEFEKDYALSGSCHKHVSEKTLPICKQHAKCFLQGSNGVAQESHSVSGQGPPALSLHSAPTVVLGSNDHGAALAERANCLPMEALVWGEGEALPRPLSTLTPGQRILCYDRLGGNLKHAAVSEMREIVGPVTWNTVTLVDGTKLKLTADHPVQPVPAETQKVGTVGPWNMTSPIQSGELRPGLDSLLVLKVLPVQVKRIELHEEVGARASLSVQQPERHAIFVAPPGQQGGPLQTMAVESSAVFNSAQVNFGAHNSFLDIRDGGAPGNLSFQAQSAPPSLCGLQASALTRAALAQTEGQAEGQAFTRAASEASLPCQSMSSCSLTDSSLMSSHGSHNIIINGPVNVTLGHDGTAIAAHPSESGQGKAALSSLAGLRKAGWSSAGSARHGTCQCKPCAFENRRQFFFTKPCFKGALCEFCHEGHEQDIRKAKRQAVRKQKRQAWMGESETAEASSAAGNSQRWADDVPVEHLGN